MNKLSTKTRMISAIALVALLVVVGMGVALAGTPANPSEPLGPVPPSSPPPPCRTEGAEQGTGTHWVHLEAPLPPELLPLGPPVPSAPPPSGPTEGAEPGKGGTSETVHLVATTDPDTGERIYVQTTVRMGIFNPWKVGSNVHGRAYTHATHVSGVSTVAIVDVWLWWWDGSQWRVRGSARDVDTSAWLGWYRAEATPVALGVTGWWVTTARHRVYRNGVRVHHTTSESGHEHLTFP